MNRRSLFASILMACLLSIGLGGLNPAEAASAGQSLLASGKPAGNGAVPVDYRGYGPRIYAPIAPTYRAFDYPYYYSRGYYPRHIGPGYVYYGHPYAASRSYYTPRHGGRCSYWHRRCVANWGAGNEDYYGCMEYHGCE